MELPHADTAGTRSQILESAQVRHDDDARARRRRGRPCPADDGAVRDEHSPIWFFTAKDNEIVQKLGHGRTRAIATFASKGHDLFATVHGTLTSTTTAQ